MSVTARAALLRALRTRAAPVLGPTVTRTTSNTRTSLRSSIQSVRWISSSKKSQATAFHSQIEDPSNAAILNSLKTSSLAPQTLTEKIVQKYAVGLAEGKTVVSGDYVTISPHHCMTHDNSWPVALKFMSIGATKINNPHQIVMTLDHDVQNKSEKNLKKYQQIEDFAKQQEVDFYPAGRGIGHQIMVEEGYAWPGTLVVASDSHTNMYGGIGCLGTPVVRTDAASIWATGRTWWQIPPVANVVFKGVLPAGVTGKDIIVALCGLFDKDDVLNHAIEFTGSEETMQSLPIDARLTIANMTTEWGALSGLFPMDSLLEGWLRSKATMSALDSSEGRAGTDRFTHSRIDQLLDPRQRLAADRGAKYAKQLYLDLNTLTPYVSGPNSVKVATPLADLEAQNIPINKAYLVSCTNSRASDLAAAAKVFKDAAETHPEKQVPKIAPGVQFYIAAASLPEQKIAEEQGDWQALLAAGATPLPAGCGPCIGLGTGLLEPGEVGISATNRNFKGRMGSTDAKAYLASPEVVAASALSGTLSGPGWYKKPENWTGVSRGSGDGIKEEDRMLAADEVFDKILGQLDDIISTAEQEFGSPTSSSPETSTPSTASTKLYPGFPSRISGEIVFCDADNINTDGIYPGKYTYQDGITRSQMSAVCMENYDPSFASLSKPGDILVSGFNFGCGSSREQAATAILARDINLVVAGSFGNIFSRNSINNALMGLEVPRLIRRLREKFSETAKPAEQVADKEITEPTGNATNETAQSLDSTTPGPLAEGGKRLTRRTGWTLVWDVEKSEVSVKEGQDGQEWTEKVGELPANVQEIIAKGGLEKWVQMEIGKGGS